MQFAWPVRGAAMKVAVVLADPLGQVVPAGQQVMPPLHPALALGAPRPLPGEAAPLPGRCHDQHPGPQRGT